MNQFFIFVGVLFVISIAVTCVGGLYDLHKARQPVTWERMLKALSIAALFCCVVLAFGAASWAIGVFYSGAMKMTDWASNVAHINPLLLLASPLPVLIVIGFAKAALKRKRSRR